MPIKISGPITKAHMAHFLTDDNTPIGKDHNINIIIGIHKIKGKTSVNALVSNYTNQHLMSHKGEYIGHLEPAVMDTNTIEQKETHQISSITLKKIMAEMVTPEQTQNTMNYLQLYRMTLTCYYGNMNINLQRMKLQLGLPL